MEKQTEKIKRFSKVVHILLKVAFIALIVVGALQAFSLLWSFLDLNTEVLAIAGGEAEYPLLFKFGETKVYLPMAWETGFDFLGVRSIASASLSGLLLTIFTIGGLGFAKVVFKLLKGNGSPFRDDVIGSLKKLSIALLLMGAVSGLVPFVAAGVVWVLCLIFEYGRILQNESDTTL
ncbi:MAG: hypothetical protein LBS11_05685 [Oscillospiraceae bacterium]|jgi:hypothetical protein|nr:hypothetical protein [Oscillospiraceae bacterium]